MKRMLLLSLTCILFTATTVRSQDFAGGAGTESNPYLIASAQQLGNLRKYLGDAHKDTYFKLGNDIEIASFSMENRETAGWEPIGTNENRFFGHLDGGGHKVTGLWINRESADCIGLFGVIAAGSTIDSLGVTADGEKGGVTGHSYVGGLVGLSYGSIAGSYATSDVTGNASYVGGLTGGNFGSIAGCHAAGNAAGVGYIGGLAGISFGSITDSHATGGATGSSSVGGLAGYSDKDITNSHATGDVTGFSYVGGLAGESGGNVISCHATGDVTGSGADNSFIGGLVGYYQYEGVITNSYATGNVTGDSDVGGLVGYQFSGNITNSYATGDVAGISSVGGLAGYSDRNITNCYAAGNITGERYVGGLAGYSRGSSIVNCYFLKIIGGPEGVSSGANDENVVGLAAAQMMLQSSFPGFNFATTWEIEEGKTFPYLRERALPPVGNLAPPAVTTLHVFTADGVLHIGGLTTGERLVVYTIQGQPVYNGRATASEQRIPLAARGVYIVVAGRQSVKTVNSGQ